MRRSWRSAPLEDFPHTVNEYRNPLVGIGGCKLFGELLSRHQIHGVDLDRWQVHTFAFGNNQ